MDLGRPDELRKRVDRLAAQPNLTVEQRFRYGAVYLQWLNDATAAKKQFDEVLKVNSDPEMKLEVAVAYHQMHQDDLANQMLAQVKSTTLTPELETKLGTTYLQMDQYDQAAGIFQNMMARNPNDGSAVGGLLMVYDKKGDCAGAVHLLEQWTTAHPTDTQAKSRLEKYRKAGVRPAGAVVADPEGIDAVCAPSGHHHPPFEGCGDFTGLSEQYISV